MGHHCDLVEEIGSGVYGTVWSAIHRKTGSMRAVKRLEDFVTETEFQGETKLLSLLMQEDVKGFIVRFYGTYEEKRARHIVFDLMTCDLGVWARSLYPKGVPLAPLRVLSRRLLEAFEFLGDRNIVHGDVKPDNFLMATNDPASLKVSDFGLASIMERQTIAMVYPNFTGALYYRAPEIILSYPFKNPQAPDMWGVGCVLLEVMHHKGPFSPPCIHEEEIPYDLWDVLVAQAALLWKPPPYMLGNALNQPLCRRMERCSIVEAYQKCSPALLHVLDKYLPQDVQGICPFDVIYDFFLQLLALDPFERATPSGALKHCFVTYIGEKSILSKGGRRQDGWSRR